MMLTGREVIEQCRRMAPSEEIAQHMARGYIAQRGASCAGIIREKTLRILLDNRERLR